MILKQALLVAVVGTSVAAGYYQWIPTHSILEALGPARYAPTYTIVPGDEVALVYVGKSSCGFSNVDDLPESLDRARRVLKSRAEDAGLAFTAIGVANDAVPEAGWKHLHRFGRFDQVITGAASVNLGMQRYVLQDFPSISATPQIVIVRRTREAGPGVTPRVHHEQLLSRLIGISEIRRWAAAGFPLPSFAQKADE